MMQLVPAIVSATWGSYSMRYRLTVYHNSGWDPLALQLYILGNFQIRLRNINIPFDRGYIQSRFMCP